MRPLLLIRLIAWVLVVGLWAVKANAQNRPPATERPYFVGFHVFEGRYESALPRLALGGESENEEVARRWQLVAGRLLSPRLAVQAGYTYAHQLTQSGATPAGSTPLGQAVSRSSSDERWVHCLPVLARYAAARRAHLLQVEALLGATWLLTRAEASVTYQTASQVLARTDLGSRAGQLYCTGGAGLRYLVGRRLEANLDLTYSRSFRAQPGDATAGVWGLTGAAACGLRYRFDVRKRASGPAL